MKFILYETRNNITEEIYVGAHKTKNLDDNYFGSGIEMKKAIKEHGKKNFTKTIIGQFETEADSYIAEAKVVTLDFIQSKKTYNRTLGGGLGKIPKTLTIALLGILAAYFIIKKSVSK